MPYAGHSLDLLGTTTSNVPANEDQLLGLACSVRKLSKCEIKHGNICRGNVILMRPESAVSKAARLFLFLIDVGGVAPGYENDVAALGTLFYWCLEHSTGSKDNAGAKKTVIIAAALLKEGDLDLPTGVLLLSNTKSSFKRSLPRYEDAKRRRL